VGDKDTEKEGNFETLRGKRYMGRHLYHTKELYGKKKVEKLGHTTESKRRKEMCKLCKKKCRIQDDGGKGSHFLFIGWSKST
jgi:hypothetical protein